MALAPERDSHTEDTSATPIETKSLNESHGSGRKEGRDAITLDSTSRMSSHSPRALITFW